MRRRRIWLVLGVATLLVAMQAARSSDSRSARAGGLVRTTLASEVGVVLDEIPASMRGRVAAAMLAKPASFWIARAREQLGFTTYRLVFREAFYDAKKGALPLPPEAKWRISLVGKPQRHRIDGHDVVGVHYSFASVILTDAASPGASEPKLAKVGGVWKEPFVLPVDPELLFQRTGFACMDESQFPFGSVDSEETQFFYDQTAEPEKALSSVGYHYTRMPKQSCVAALHDHVGAVKTAVRYQRLAWSPTLADRYRYGKVTGVDPDLELYRPDALHDQTTYRYIHSAGTGGCEVVEHSVEGTGWRRLLQFTTSDQNVGERDLTIGGVDYAISGHPGDLDRYHLYVFSACHHHFHFRYYGQLSWHGKGGPILNTKQGFCLQSTFRVANRETSSLVNPFAGCDYQGIAAGWIDQYQIGLSAQWIDSTSIPPGVGLRSFHSNPYGILCEGKFVDAKGRPLGPKQPVVWAPTKYKTPDGKTVSAPLCKLSPNWDRNNTDSVKVRIERQGLGLITTACTRGQIGPLRNCGFGKHPTTAPCRPGQKTTATFSIPSGARPQVVRLTEYSHALRTPIPARYEDSWVPLRPGVSDQPAMLANEIVTADEPLAITFRCPSPRSGGLHEPGGTYSVYTAPVFPGDPAATVTRG
jgi:Lysyl oxidase